ncbi:serine hydrolase [Candidatus Saganbacteria bacterium]|nr:serine hydrolase [Candidatus Saganbacteria bacterium]
MRLISSLILFFCVINQVKAALLPEKLAAIDRELRPFVESYYGRAGFCFLDLESSSEVSVYGHQIFPAASVAKVPVMVTAFHLADAGQLDLNQKIVLRKTDKQGGSGILRWLRSGRTYTIQNLIRMMIVISDNTATKMIVDQVGCARINGFVNTDLGLAQTQVVDPTMLNDPTGEVFNRTSPCDMARLAAMIEKGTHWQKSSRQQMLTYMKSQRYRWGLWRGVPAGIKIADKTGNLDNVFNDAGIIYSPAGRYALAIFTRDIKSREAREIFRRVGTAVYETYTGQKVVQAKSKVKVKKKIKYRKKHLKKRR